MKQLIFIILLSITMINVKAQNSNNNENKFSFATTVGTGLPMDKPSTPPFTWQVLGYYNITNRWAIGMGTGLSFYEKLLIPIHGNIRYQIGKERKFTPYTELAIGYSLAPSSDANGGIFVNPSIGVQYPLRNKMKLQIAVGYELQKLERLKTQMDSYFLKEFEEQLNHHSISFRIGLKF